jgi:hypothetical protein
LWQLALCEAAAPPGQTKRRNAGRTLRHWRQAAGRSPRCAKAPGWPDDQSCRISAFSLPIKPRSGWAGLFWLTLTRINALAQRLSYQVEVRTRRTSPFPSGDDLVVFCSFVQF